MTSTAVKGVGNILNSLTTTVTSQPVGAASTVSFQSIWNDQAGKSDTPQNFTAEQNTAKEQPVRAGESLQSKNVRKVEDKQEKPVEEQVQLDEGDQEEKLKIAMEVLGTAALNLVEQIADTLGLSETEVEDLLTQLDLEPVDLLDPENLSDFLLAAGGAEDSLSLLTDEELYVDFKLLMGELENLLKQESGVDDMTLADAYELVEQSAVEMTTEDVIPDVEEQTYETTEPIIEVAVEEDTDSPKVLTTSRTEVSTEQTYQVQPEETEDSNAAAQVVHTDRKHSEGREHSEQGGQQAGNSFLQNQQTLNTNLQPVQTGEVAGHFDVDTQDIMRQIMDYMRIQVKADMSNLEMQLHPASLGTLQISVAAKGGVITANFVAQNEAVKSALESQMVQLKESFAEQGVKVEAIEVTVQTHEFEQNLEQGRERDQETPAKGQRTRRIRLDGALAPEELEELPEEDQLTAEMMAANGSTVDYTA
ncbi:MAG: flagellar hook-length control protein FliK [Acetatifactor sp.]|nr:flagellar hook-length control protein FliK [Acetatifactor sp.]